MRRLSVCLGRLLGANDNPYLGYTLHSDKYMFPSMVTKVGLPGWWWAPKTPTVPSCIQRENLGGHLGQPCGLRWRRRGLT